MFKYSLVLYTLLASQLAIGQSINYVSKRLLGYKNINAKFRVSVDKSVSSYGWSSFINYPDSNYVKEDFSFLFGKDTLSGTTVISYSNFYKRYELLQYDNASKSTLALTGEWTDSTYSRLEFKPASSRPMWGSSGELKIKWVYDFTDPSSTTKEIWVEKDRKYLLASTYTYTTLFTPKYSNNWSSHLINVDNGELNFEVIGSGPAILIINGGPGWSSEHIKPFAEKISSFGYSCVVFDQRGTGKSVISVMDSTTINLQNVISDIEKIRNYLNIDKWTVLGHSFGALVAGDYAVKHSSEIDKLILLAPPGLSLDFLPSYQDNLNARLDDIDLKQVAYWQNESGDNPELGSYNMIAYSLPAFLYNDEKVPDVMKYITPTTWNLTTNILMWNDLVNSNFDTTKEAAATSIPVTIIQGRQDALGDANAEKVAHTFPNATIHFIEKCAHILWIDQPEETYSLLQEILKQ